MCSSCPSLFKRGRVASVLFWSPFPFWFHQSTYIASDGSFSTFRWSVSMALMPWVGIFVSYRTDCTLWTFQMFQTLQVLFYSLVRVRPCSTLRHLSVALPFWRETVLCAQVPGGPSLLTSTSDLRICHLNGYYVLDLTPNILKLRFSIHYIFPSSFPFESRLTKCPNIMICAKFISSKN